MRTTFRASVWILFTMAALIVPACKHGSDSDVAGNPALVATAESEPNDLSATAMPLPIGGAVHGSTAIGTDQDWYAITTTQSNTALRIEAFARRRDQATWSANANALRVAVFDVDGATVLYADGFFNSGDPDLPGIWLGAPGTYFIRCSNLTPGAAGGLYTLRVTRLEVTQSELEPLAGGTNDAFGTAEPLSGTAGRLTGHVLIGTSDYYALTVPANTWIEASTIDHRNGYQPWTPNDSALRLYGLDGTTLLNVADNGAGELDARLLHGVLTAGTYYLQLGGSSGPAGNTSRYLLQWALVPMNVTESEPNDDAAQANPISYGTVVRGAVSSPNADFFSFQGSAGDLVLLEVLDGNGTGSRVRVEGATNGFSGDIASAFLGTNGVSLLAQDVGEGTGADNLEVRTCILPSSGTFYVRMTITNGTSYAFRLRRLRAPAFESEGNDTPATANPLAGQQAGMLDVPGDVDVYSFTAAAGEQVVIRALAAAPLGTIAEFYDGHGSTLDPLLNIIGSDGSTVIATASYSVGARAQGLVEVAASVEICFIAPAAGTYYLSVGSASGAAVANARYVLQRE